MEETIMNLLSKLPWWVEVILLSISGLVIMAQSIIVLSPTKKDDAMLEKILAIPIVGYIINFILRFAPYQQKRDDSIKERSTD